MITIICNNFGKFTIYILPGRQSERKTGIQKKIWAFPVKIFPLNFCLWPVNLCAQRISFLSRLVFEYSRVPNNLTSTLKLGQWTPFFATPWMEGPPSTGACLVFNNRRFIYGMVKDRLIGLENSFYKRLKKQSCLCLYMVSFFLSVKNTSPKISFKPNTFTCYIKQNLAIIDAACIVTQNLN